MIGMLFLFSPSQTPDSSNLEKEEVNGKKAERAEVVMFLLIPRKFWAKGKQVFSPSNIWKVGFLGMISREFNSDSIFLVSRLSSSMLSARQLMYRLTSKSFSFPFCNSSRITLVSLYLISKLGLNWFFIFDA